MSRRFARLTPAQVAELIERDLEEEEGQVNEDQSSESEEEEEEEEVFYFDEDDEDIEMEEEDQPVRQAQQPTKSQKILKNADLRPVEVPSSAGPYNCGNSEIRWSASKPESTRRRHPSRNVLTESVAVRGDARDVDTELEAFQLFMSDDIIKEITECTNKKLDMIRQAKEAKLDEMTWKQHSYRYQSVTLTEMQAFMGICILRSFFTDLTLKQLYDPKLGPPAVKAAMGSTRYGTILRYITFDDPNTRVERRKGDKFCLIREIFDRFDCNLRLYFCPSECLTIDESLLKFRGRCPFKMYVPSKPGRYGILFRTVADANYRYLWKAWPYSGRPEAPDLSPPRVQLDGVLETVHYLVQDVKGTGRNITLDRFYTSVPLAEELAAERLTVVGTLNKNRRFLPSELTNPRGRQPGTSMFAFRNTVMLVSHCPKPKKVVLALSTQHDRPMVDSKTKKPEVILYYNTTKGGVDVVDSMLESYMGKPALKRWPTTVLFFMLGIAQVNGFTILQLNRGLEVDRRSMRLALAQQLMSPRIQERVSNPCGLNADTLAALAAVTGENFIRSQPRLPNQQCTRGRCATCLKGLQGHSDHRAAKDKMPKYAPCSICGDFVCSTHSINMRVCEACQK